MRFVDELDLAFTRIANNPKSYQLVLNEIRRSLTRTFPFLVFFTNDSDTIYILAVIHASQDPDYFRKRLTF